MDTRLSLADALTDAARAINEPRDLQATLDSIVTVALAQMPEIDHLGLSVTYRDGSVETVAASDELVRELDGLQYRLGEGPCLQTLTSAEVTVSEHVGDDRRWPRYVPRAVELGLKAQMAVRLYTHEETIGGLNMYSTQQETISEETRHMADLFATHAALALGHARVKAELSTALQTRATIGKALGILMERYGLDEDRAFEYLRRVSSTSNTKLRDVAAEVVDRTNEKLLAEYGSAS